MKDAWVERKKPSRLERRFEFDDYEQTREFLDQTADLAEATEYYPNLSFGRKHVSMTLYPMGESEVVTEELTSYANQVDEIADAARKIC